MFGEIVRSRRDWELLLHDESLEVSELDFELEELIDVLADGIWKIA